jgi:hypothetical protein
VPLGEAGDDDAPVCHVRRVPWGCGRNRFDGRGLAIVAGVRSLNVVFSGNDHDRLHRKEAQTPTSKIS